MTETAPNVNKNALLMFSKPPVPGMVKTRLTVQHGGPLSEEQAAQLFNCMMFDVLEVACQSLDRLEAQNEEELKNDPSAVKQVYDVFICTTPADSVEKMRRLFEDSGTWPREFKFLLDAGKTFDDHFDDAFEQIFAQGYSTCLSVGGDIPIMPRDHIVQGFDWLHYFQGMYDDGGVVLAPCQACGTSLVGFTDDSGMDHQGVYYDTAGRPALQAYIDKAGDSGVHIAFLDVVSDVDNSEDLAHTMTVMNALEFCSKNQDLFIPWRTLQWVRGHGLTVTAPPNDDFDSREAIDA
jgi:glycosyltransferase A (GT-A) superfamily protein (DUF2064 family)